MVRIRMRLLVFLPHACLLMHAYEVYIILWATFTPMCMCVCVCVLSNSNIFVRIDVYMSVYMHVGVYMSVYMHVGVYMSVYMHVCMVNDIPSQGWLRAVLSPRVAEKGT
jgi:hypothetical protein